MTARPMRIGPFDTDRAVLVVAEIGNNHEGSLERARQLVHEAASCGADAVKCQTFRTRLFVSPADAARYERMSRFELSPEAFAELSALARSLGLLFLSTPLDLESAAALEPLVDAYKIASGDNDFFPLIARVCETGRPLLVSTGLTDLAGVLRTTALIGERWRAGGIDGELGLLHCVSSYPAPIEEANLAAIGVLQRACGVTVGYSDHTLGIEACVLAVAAGARIIEKHFTLDKRLSDFRDHQLSADPEEFRRLVRDVKRAAAIVGAAIKEPQPSETPGLTQFRRSIVAAAHLDRAHVITGADLMWLRPAGGLPPGEESRLIGRRLRRAVAAGEQIAAGDVE